MEEMTDEGGGDDIELLHQDEDEEVVLGLYVCVTT